MKPHAGHVRDAAAACHTENVTRPPSTAHAERWALAAALLISAAVATPRARVSAAEPTLPWLDAPLLFHVSGGSSDSVAFIARQLETANRIYAPHRVRFADAGRRELPAGHTVMVSRSDRDGLAEFVAPNAVNVFVVGRLMDVDEPGRVRRGVHWRPRPAPEKRLVIVSLISSDYVLAHELGHFLGNRAHSDVPGNVMSYLPGDSLPVLNPSQASTVRKTLGRMRSAGEL